MRKSSKTRCFATKLLVGELFLAGLFFIVLGLFYLPVIVLGLVVVIYLSIAYGLGLCIEKLMSRVST